MRHLFITILFFFLSIPVFAQDFRCQISVNSNQISGSNKTRYNALQEALYTFINDRKWSNYNLKTNERVDCALLINLTDVAGEVMTATITVQLTRPVYNASYKTNVLNFQDKSVKFTWEEGTPLEYAENTNLSQLTSLIAFYLNLFLAMDFDTFSLNGGAEYYAKCQSIVSFCQNVSEPGWKSFESGQSNRYWLMENLTNGQYGKIHEFLYNYHRLGLDVMSENPDAGRAVIAESLRLLQQVNAQKPNLYIVRLLVEAKSAEIVEIFKEATPSEKTQVINIMKQIDPAGSNKYDAINQGSR